MRHGARFYLLLHTVLYDCSHRGNAGTRTDAYNRCLEIVQGRSQAFRIVIRDLTLPIHQLTLVWMNFIHHVKCDKETCANTFSRYPKLRMILDNRKHTREFHEDASV
ncbi:hypothetical protein OG21DRAFT_379032 [Imleria badia]|nr:hypothetical protein OG21DRAFT_379032 [Imleria badia]